MSATFLLLVQKKSSQKRRRRAKLITHSEGDITIRGQIEGTGEGE